MWIHTSSSLTMASTDGPRLLPTLAGGVDVAAFTAPVVSLCGEFLTFDLTEAGARDGTVCGALALSELHALRCNPRTRAENMRVTAAADAPLLEADLRDAERAAAAACGGAAAGLLLVDISTQDTGRDTTALAAMQAAGKIPSSVLVVLSTGFHMSPPMATATEDREGGESGVFRPRNPPANLKEAVLMDLKKISSEDEQYAQYYFDHDGEFDRAPPQYGCVSCSPGPRGLCAASRKLVSDCVEACNYTECKTPLNVFVPSGFGYADLAVLVTEVIQRSDAPVVLLNAEQAVYASCQTADGGVDVAAAAPFVDLFARYRFLHVSLESLAWDGLAQPAATHPFSHPLPPASFSRALLAALRGVDAARVCCSTLHCMKMCSRAWGGPGKAGAIAAGGGTVGVPGHLAGGWWRAPPARAAKKVFWHCDCCGKKTEEATPDRSFRKLTFRFCSVACLKAHCPVPPEVEKEKKEARRGGGGGGAVSWGVACPSR